jgi:hypothetical protein
METAMNQERSVVTHEEVQRAIARFRAQGRSITRLNPQPTPACTVGLETWNSELNFLDLITPDWA